MLRGAYYAPIALAFALVARHGRYLPLWLPECGMVAAYAAYFSIERARFPLLLGMAVAVLAGSLSALVAHYALFAGHVARSEPFAALLRGIGVIVLLDNIASLLTGGYALAFSRLAIPSSGRFRMVHALLGSDALALGCVPLLAGGLWAAVNHTRSGLQYRSVSANRQVATQYGLRVQRIDFIVVVMGGLLCAIGGITNGLRYGLTATMMSTTALKAVAVVVAVGYDRLLTVALGMLSIGVLESLCQARIRFSAFEDGVSYAALAIGLVVHYVVWPWWRHWRERRSWGAEKQLAEARL